MGAAVVSQSIANFTPVNLPRTMRIIFAAADVEQGHPAQVLHNFKKARSHTAADFRKWFSFEIEWIHECLLESAAKGWKLHQECVQRTLASFHNYQL